MSKEPKKTIFIYYAAALQFSNDEPKVLAVLSNPVDVFGYAVGLYRTVHVPCRIIVSKYRMVDDFRRLSYEEQLSALVKSEREEVISFVHQELSREDDDLPF